MRTFVWAEHTPEFLPDSIAYAMGDDGTCYGGATASTPGAAIDHMRKRLLRRGFFDGDIETVVPPVYDHPGWRAASLRAKGAREADDARIEREVRERIGVATGWLR